MTEPLYHIGPGGRRLAYRRIAGQGPGVVFLGGYRSDMEGTKALHLEQWARDTGRAFLRFDYSGHGASDGTMLDTGPQDWSADALSVLDALTEGPQVLVGSSMGGWMSLLAARARPERIAGLVTIAAAPDFVIDGFLAGLSDADRATLEREGRVLLSEDRFDEPEYLTAHMVAGARETLVLNQPLSLPFPTRFLQGTQDEAVETATALRLLDHAQGPDMRLTLVKSADHRFSTPECLAILVAAVEEVLS